MPFMIKKIATVIGLYLLTICAFAQAPGFQAPKIAQGALRSDFLLLRDTLQKIHAGLYRYKSKAVLDPVFDSCLATIRDSMTILDFYALTKFAVAAIDDGHTNCRLSRDVMTDYVAKVKVFPAMVMFIHNKAFIFCCRQNASLDKTELLSIDHRPMDEIIQRLFTYIPSDGSIQSRKNWEIPEDFQLLYNIVYGAKNSYAITCKNPVGEIKTATLQADTIKNFACAGPFTRPDKYLKLNYRPGNIAVLTVATFFNGFLKTTGENFRHFLDSSFQDIKAKKTAKLIIDLRSNQGGNDNNGEMLYSYLTSKPFMYYASKETVKGKIAEKDNPDLGLQQPNENNYKGKVYALINGRSFSGTAEFSSILKSNGRGLFIGEECGGGYYGNTSGDEVMVTLPNTGITARIPLVKYTMAVKKTGVKDRGVIPDHIVYPTITDIVEKKDSQLEYALQLVQKN